MQHRYTETQSSRVRRIVQYLWSHKLAAVIALSIIVRVGILLAFPSVFAYDQTGVVHGSDAYDDYAVNLLDTGVYGRTPGEPDAFIPPLYSYALAAVYGVFGRGYIQAGLFHTLLDALSIAMLYEIARRIFSSLSENTTTKFSISGEMVGALAGLFYALYPYLIFQNLTLIDTPFFIVQLHAFVLLMILLRERETLDRKTWLIAIAGGVVLGASLLTRPIMPPLALLTALWFLFRRSLWQTVLRLTPVALVGVLVIVPWIIRNYGIYDAFVPMTTTSGANFWQGNSEYTIPVFRAGYDVQWTAPELEAEDRNSREADAERFALGFEFLRQNPGKIPELLWVKFLVHWSIDIAPRYNPQEGEQFRLDENSGLIIEYTGESIDGVNPANTSYDEPLFDLIGRWIHRFYYGGLFFLALAGVAFTWRKWREVSLLWFVQISMTLVYIFFHPSTRYRVPTDPLLFVFSAYTLVWLWRWIQARKMEKSNA